MGSDQVKSLGASKRSDMFWFEPEFLVVVTDPTDPLYDERVHLPIHEPTVESIMEFGVLEPIIYTKDGVRDDNSPVIKVVDGRQRTRCAQEANRRLRKAKREPIKIPGVPRQGTDAELFGISVLSNALRQDDPPMTQARAMRKCLDLGMDPPTVAKRYGVDVQTVKNRLKLLDLHPDLQAAVDTGKLGLVMAYRVASVPKAEQGVALAEATKTAEASATKLLGVTVLTPGPTPDGEPIQHEHLTRTATTGDRPLVDPKPNGAKVTPKKALEAALGKRGKVRARSIKSKDEIASFRDSLLASKSEVAPACAAVLSWALGDEDALAGFGALKKRLEMADGLNLDGEE